MIIQANRGIDAPESEMPYGKEAKAELLKLVEGKPLKIHVYGVDQYGRRVGDVYCGGIFVQVRSGRENHANFASGYRDSLIAPILLCRSGC